MKHLKTCLVFVLASGMGVALAIVWLLSAHDRAGLPAAYAAELHVCPSGCPYSSIQAAVDAASAGDVIKVAVGTYRGVSIRAGLKQVVYIDKGITIQGGYTTANWTTSDPVANPTTLDAQGGGRVLYIAGNISPTIAGLRLTGGNAVGLGGGICRSCDAGGGVYVLNATAVIRNNWIFSNSSGLGCGSGAGLYLNYSNATLSGNMVMSNTAGNGGGLYLNLSNATIKGNIVTANIASSGGGLYLDFSNATLNGNTIMANTAASGGGLYLAGGNTTLRDNMVMSNSAGIGGGLALYFDDSMLINNIVVGNQGDGITIVAGSPRLLHTTIAHNGGGGGSGIFITNSDPCGEGCDPSSTVALTDTILVSQSVGITVTSGGNTAALEATLWGSGDWANGVNWGGDGKIVIGTVNVFGDPGFVDPAAGNYHIGSGSAAINAGVSAGVLTDIDNQPRPSNAPDLGADEYWPLGTPKYIYLPFVLKNH